MPQPTAGDLHVDSLLTNVSLAFLQADENFVAPTGSPVVRVMKQSDLYAVYTRADFNRDEMRKRAPGTESDGGGWNVDNTNSYFADRYSLHKDIDDDIRNNADAIYNLDRDATLYLTQQAKIRMERLFNTNIFTTATWTGSTGGGDVTPGNKWDTATGDPIGDIDAERDSVSEFGFKPNVAIFGVDAWRVFKNNADVLDRIKHTQRGVVTQDLAAGLLEIDTVRVARSVVNTAAEGATEVSAFALTGDSVLLLYSNPNPSPMQPSAAYTFAWTGRRGTNEMGMRMRSFRMEENDADRREIDMWVDIKQTAAELGARLINVDT